VTAPRHTGRRSASVAPSKPLPGTATLVALSLAIAVSLPIATLIELESDKLPGSESAFGVAAKAAAVAFGVVWLALWAVRRRAGTNGQAGNVTLPTVVAAALIVAAYGAITYVWARESGPEADFSGSEIFRILGAAAIATYAVVYTTLSMARR